MASPPTLPSSFHALEPPQPVDAVLFDFHTTLVDQGDPHDWLELGWRRAGRPGTAREALGAERFDGLAAWLHRIWEHALELDPRGERDLSVAKNRQVFHQIMARAAGLPEDVRGALYDAQFELWHAYDDAAPVLRELRARGKRLALVSNCGADLVPVLERLGLGGLLHAVIMSWQVGAVKPAAAIFERALEGVGVPASRALMVGDNARDDGGAAHLGIRTLILPRTAGRVHGLDLVLRAVT